MLHAAHFKDVICGHVAILRNGSLLLQLSLQHPSLVQKLPFLFSSQRAKTTGKKQEIRNNGRDFSDVTSSAGFWRKRAASRCVECMAQLSDATIRAIVLRMLLLTAMAP